MSALDGGPDGRGWGNLRKIPVLTPPIVAGGAVANVARSYVFGVTNYTLAADAGSYALTGAAATLKRGLRLDAGAGSFAVTGQAASLKLGLRLDAGTGAFGLTGASVGFNAQRYMAAGSGAFALSGQQITFRATRKLEADAGAFSITGDAATLVYAGGAPPDPTPPLGMNWSRHEVSFARDVKPEDDEKRRRDTLWILMLSQ